ncbi:MAG: hypothetical protein Q7S92_02735 [Candidatus Diapherotrites archaeon]|nr:hypothetical protein [Candidatus Diapherotrites archaeon]
MNDRGQFSVDLLLAVGAVFTFIIALQGIAATMGSTQAEHSIIIQESELSLKIASLFNESRILQEGKFKIEYATPNLKVPGKNNQPNCSIRIETNPKQVVVAYDLDGQNLEASSQIVLTEDILNQMIFPENLNCGEKLTIEKR